MNQQQLQQILTVAAVVAPMLQNSQTTTPTVNQQPAVNQQNPGYLLLLQFSLLTYWSRLQFRTFLLLHTTALDSCTY